jgi:hypothetical protein
MYLQSKIKYNKHKITSWHGNGQILTTFSRFTNGNDFQVDFNIIEFPAINLKQRCFWGWVLRHTNTVYVI